MESFGRISVTMTVTEHSWKQHLWIISGYSNELWKQRELTAITRNIKPTEHKISFLERRKIKMWGVFCFESQVTVLYHPNWLENVHRLMFICKETLYISCSKMSFTKIGTDITSISDTLGNLLWLHLLSVFGYFLFYLLW